MSRLFDLSQAFFSSFCWAFSSSVAVHVFANLHVFVNFISPGVGPGKIGCGLVFQPFGSQPWH
jgi:hypothetical protein